MSVSESFGMGKIGSCREKDIINVLIRGWELSNQLRGQLQPGASNGAYDFLVAEIVSSYDSALALLNSLASVENGDASEIEGNMLGSRNFTKNSPRGEGVDPVAEHRNSKRVFKKRRAPDEQLRVCSSAKLENDGYTWKKYGQKNIIGTNYPRSYYRCSHRNSQGCLATKQVQLADDDPSVFQIVYKGKHSCFPERNRSHKYILDARIRNEREEESLRNAKQKIIGNETGHTIETNELDPKGSPIEVNYIKAHIFSNAMDDNSFGASYLTTPATSDSYYPLNEFGYSSSVNSQSDFAGMFCDETPATLGDVGFFTDLADIDSHFIEPLDCFE